MQRRGQTPSSRKRTGRPKRLRIRQPRKPRRRGRPSAASVRPGTTRAWIPRGWLRKVGNAPTIDRPERRWVPERGSCMETKGILLDYQTFAPSGIDAFRAVPRASHVTNEPFGSRPERSVGPRRAAGKSGGFLSAIRFFDLTVPAGTGRYKEMPFLHFPSGEPLALERAQAHREAK